MYLLAGGTVWLFGCAYLIGVIRMATREDQLIEESLCQKKREDTEGTCVVPVLQEYTRLALE